MACPYMEAPYMAAAACPPRAARGHSTVPGTNALRMRIPRAFSDNGAMLVLN